jgi:hypothetical protein
MGGREGAHKKESGSTQPRATTQIQVQGMQQAHVGAKHSTSGPVLAFIAMQNN